MFLTEEEEAQALAIAQARVKAAAADRQAYDDAPLSTSIQRGAAGLLQGITFGAGDEIAAGVGGLGDYVKSSLTGGNLSLGDAYDQRLDYNRGLLEDFREHNPVGAIGSELIGALLTAPISAGGTALYKGLGTVGKAGLAGLEGALAGGMYGFNAGEGGIENRLEGAEGGVVAGGLTGVLAPTIGAAFKRGSDTLSDVGLANEMSSVGVTASDVKRAAKGPSGFYFRQTGEIPHKQFHDTAKKAGIYKGSKDAKDLVVKANQALQTKGDEINSILTAADEVKGNVKFKPNFRKIEKYIDDNFTGADRQAAKKHFEKQLGLLDEELDGTLTNLHRKKQNLYKTTYGTTAHSSAKKQVDRQIAKSLKDAVEDSTDILAKSGKLDDSTAGQIKKLNEDIGGIITMSESFEKRAAADSTSDVAKKLIGALRTTGGFGVPLIVGTQQDGLGTGLAAQGLGMALLNPRARFALGSAMRKGGGAMSGLGSNIGSRAGRVATQVQMMGDQDFSYENPVDEFLAQRGGVISEPAQAEQAPTPQPAQTGKYDQLVPHESPTLKRIVNTIIDIESAGDPQAVSSAGAQGLMQLMPEIQQAFGVTDPFDPEQNVRAGTQLLMEELQRFKSLPLAVAAYNAGSPRVNAAIKKAGSNNIEAILPFLPRETQDYVRKFMSRMV